MMTREELEHLLKQIQGQEEIMEMFMTQNAKQLYHRYQVLQEAGFAEDDALQIILQRGMM